MQMAPPKPAQCFLVNKWSPLLLEAHRMVSTYSISWASIAGAVALISTVVFKEDYWIGKIPHDLQKSKPENSLRSITMQPLSKLISHKLTRAPNYSTSINTVSSF